MTLDDEVRAILHQSGYKTSPGISDTLQFEDDTLLGFVWLAKDVKSIIDGWEDVQRRFVVGNAKNFRKSESKSWNLYSIFLTSGAITSDQTARLNAIEEDFSISRKIAKGGLQSANDVHRALLPLLPIQFSVFLDVTDSGARLRRRLSNLPAAAVDILLSDVKVSIEQFLASHDS